jgi:glycyl-tRNA synthetase beta chain
VVRPRLTDAEFFFKQDKKQKLEDFNLRLQNVVFQAQLGTVYDKAVRVSKLAAFIAERTELAVMPQWAARAGLLSKCDLATEMVGEFPKCRVAGYYYALNDGEPDDVALALNEQYMPRGAGAELPTTLTGAILAMADKLDTLVGIFGIGMLPTGSKDPYALRRAALGVLRILIDKRWISTWLPAVRFAIGQFGTKVKPSRPGRSGARVHVRPPACALRRRRRRGGRPTWRFVPCSRARPWTSISACKPYRRSAICRKPMPWLPRTSASRIC